MRFYISIYLFKGILVYLGDILIYTESMEEHVKLDRAVLEELCAVQLYTKLSKCEFHKDKIDYMGYRWWGWIQKRCEQY